MIDAGRVDIFELMFEHEGMTAPAYDSDDGFDDSVDRFDDSDGAYAVAEPDPFADPATPAPSRPSLRTELGPVPAGPVSTLFRPTLPPLPVPPGLRELLPDGLRRGSTIAVTSSVSLLLALLAGPSENGAWMAMVGMPSISADAAAEAGIELGRLAIINPPNGGWTGPSWTTAVGALLDAVDVVVARPGFASNLAGLPDMGGAGVAGSGFSHGLVGDTGLADTSTRLAGTSTGLADTSTGLVGTSAGLADTSTGLVGTSTGLANTGRLTVTDGEARRLTARARSKDAVLVLFGQRSQSWPAVELRLSAEHGHWAGIGDGYGRLTQHQLLVSATGKGRAVRPRSTELWL